MRTRAASGGRPRLDFRSRLYFRFFRDCHGHWSGPCTQPTLHFTLNIMGKLSGSGLGEVHAVPAAQSPGLAFNIGARLSVAAVFVDEAVPYVDIDDASFIGPASVEVVEKRDVGSRFLPAQWRQPHPEHRYSGGLQGRDRIVDTPDVGFAPRIGAEFQ